MELLHKKTDFMLSYGSFINSLPTSLSLHKQIRQSLKSHFKTFTGHGWSQRAPCHPAVQVQDPSTGLHFALLAQWQVALHPGPQVPIEQGVEQSGARQPADTQRTVSHF